MQQGRSLGGGGGRERERLKEVQGGTFNNETGFQ